MLNIRVYIACLEVRTLMLYSIQNDTMGEE